MNNLCDGRKVYINGNLVEDVLDIPILKIRINMFVNIIQCKRA